MRIRVALVALASAALLTLPRAALGKAVHQSPYTYKQTFGSALRLVKVDLGYAVAETDAEWGYFVFEYTSSEAGKRKIRGTFQFVELREAVQVTLELSAMPSYHEQLIVQKLRRKLEEEHGAPPERPRKDKDKSKDKGEQPPDEKKPEGEKRKDEGEKR